MFNAQVGDAWDALYRNQLARATAGYGVIDLPANAGPQEGPCAVSPASGGDGVECAPGEVRIDGTRVTISSDVATIDPVADSAHRRRDVVYATSAGDIDVLKGDPGEPYEDQNGNPLEREQAPVPQPHATHTLTAGVVLAVVWRIPGASISVDDIEDRRLPEINPAGLSVDERTETLPLSSLADGDVRSLPIIVGAGATIDVLEWGMTHVDDARSGGTGGSAPPANVSVELVGPDGAVIQAANQLRQTGNPVLSTTAGGTGNAVYQLRISNQSGTDILAPEGVGAYCKFEVL
ncbi:hypothetical protein [Natrinema soli]|uniref:Uncharacterized protein n=1 Tax=Natrinema soli TaxID=1930624 RepID=A0ABD5SLH6_9EURY|nr:hypothetical protein [Natrinema soli]